MHIEDAHKPFSICNFMLIFVLYCFVQFLYFFLMLLFHITMASVFQHLTLRYIYVL